MKAYLPWKLRSDHADGLPMLESPQPDPRRGLGPIATAASVNKRWGWPGPHGYGMDRVPLPEGADCPCLFFRCLLGWRFGRFDADLFEQVFPGRLLRNEFAEQVGQVHLAPAHGLFEGVGNRIMRLRFAE